MPIGTSQPNNNSLSLYPGKPWNIRNTANALKYSSGKSADASLWSTTGDALTQLQGMIDHIWSALQQNIPIPNPFQIFSPSGALIAEIGDMVDPSNNTAYEGIWVNNLYVGGSGPATAEMIVTPAGITINNVKITETGPDGTIVIDPTVPDIVITSTAAGTPTLTLSAGGASGPELELQVGSATLVIGISGTEPQMKLEDSFGETLIINPLSIGINGTNAGDAPSTEIGQQNISIRNNNDHLVFSLTSNNTPNSCVATFENDGGTIVVTIDTTADTANAMSIVGGDLQIGTSGTGYAQLSISGLLVENALGSLVAIIGNAGGNGELLLQNSGGTVSVTIATGSTTVVSVNGGNLNVSGVYQQNGTPGISVSRTFLTSLTFASNAVFGTPGAGQSNGSVVTGANVEVNTFSGGLLTA